MKGDWKPIISEEKWQKVQEILAEKTKLVQADTKGAKCVGKPKSDDVWVRKLRCSCGSKYRKNKWRTNKMTNEMVFGYQCYNQIKWFFNLLGDNYAVSTYLEGRKNNPSFKGGSAKDLEFFPLSTGCYC